MPAMVRGVLWVLSLLLAFGWLASSCTPAIDLARGQQIARLEVTAPPGTSSAEPPPLLDVAPPYDLIVGSGRGLEAWDRDGKLVRRISDEPARFPRWLDANTVLVIVPHVAAPLSRGFRVESVDVASGERRVISRVPEFGCTAEVPEAERLSELTVRYPGDFRVVREEGEACIGLLDNYPSAATFAFDLRIQVRGGRVRRWVRHKPERCTIKGFVESGTPEFCFAAEQPEPEPDTRTFKLVPSAERLLVEQGAHRLFVPGFFRERVSPSRRWVLLYGDVSEGDYVHRNLLLLDLHSGSLFPIPSPGEPWTRLAQVGVDTVVNVPVQNTQEAIGESSIVWLGASEGSELLLIDDLVVRPGLLVFAPEGDIAL
jgi:hypothetical protein